MRGHSARGDRAHKTHRAVPAVVDGGRLVDTPPWVLVGHSYGGLLVRLLAHARPRETAGVVLVDAVGRDADGINLRSSECSTPACGLVVRAVRAVVRASREPASLPACSQVFSGPGVRCVGG